MARYFRNTGNTNWSVATNWSATDGGASFGAVPNSSDDVFFTSNSGDCVVNTTGLLGRSINFTGYTRIFTVNNTFTISADVTLSSAMTIAGSAAMNVNAVSTLRSNGKIWTPNLTLSGLAQFTFADDWIILGNLNLGNNSQDIIGAGNITANALVSSSAGAFTYEFQNGRIYRFNEIRFNVASPINHTIVRSITPGTRVSIRVFQKGSVQFVDFIDVDASGGRTIFNYSGTSTNCINITSGTTEPTSQTANSIII